METRNSNLNPPKLEIFKYLETRPMTVIGGIPFYCSSGVNFRFKNTWLPHRGIQEGRGWIMKPFFKQLPPDVLSFCKSYHISKKVPLRRFGTIKTMCISASLGGGFWKSRKGKDLLSYLREAYPEEFLNKETVENLHKELASESLSKLVNPIEINQKLTMQGSILTHGVINSRFPLPAELPFFFDPELAGIRPALSMMLTTGNRINKETCAALLQLKKDPVIYQYLLDHFVLEDAQQVDEIVKMCQTSQCITLENLQAIDQLNSPLVANSYSHLLNTSQDRVAVRHLRRINKLDEESLAFANRLSDSHILRHHIYLKLLGNELSFAAIKKLPQESQVNENALSVIVLLKKKQLLEAHIDLLANQVGIGLIHWYNNHYFSEDKVRLLTFLNELGLLIKSNIKLLKNEDACDALITLMDCDCLDKEAIDILNQLRRLDLLDDINLLCNKTSFQFVKELYEKHKLDQEALGHLIANRKAQHNSQSKSSSSSDELELYENELAQPQILPVYKRLKKGLLFEIPKLNTTQNQAEPLVSSTLQTKP